MPRGGKREGCGRKRHNPIEVKGTISLTISPALASRLESQASVHQLSISLFAEKIFKEYFDEL
jgi:hypothetical protein